MHGAQVGDTEVLRPYDLVAIDLTDQAGLLNLGDLAARQGDVLLQAQRGLGIGEIVVNTVLEGDPYERQAIKGSRADIGNARRGIEADFHRRGVITLHLLRRQPRGLCGDFEDHRRGIRVGLDVQAQEGEYAGGQKHDQREQHNSASGEPERQNTFQHFGRSLREAAGDQVVQKDGTLGDFELSRPHTLDDLIESVAL